MSSNILYILLFILINLEKVLAVNCFADLQFPILLGNGASGHAWFDSIDIDSSGNIAFAGYGYDTTLGISSRPLVGFFDTTINRITWIYYVHSTAVSLSTIPVVKFSQDYASIGIMFNTQDTVGIKLSATDGTQIFNCIPFGWGGAGNSGVFKSSIDFDVRGNFLMTFVYSDDLSFFLCKDPGAASSISTYFGFVDWYISQTRIAYYISTTDEYLLAGRTDSSGNTDSYVGIQIYNAITMNDVVNFYHTYSGSCCLYFGPSLVFEDYPKFAFCLDTGLKTYSFNTNSDLGFVLYDRTTGSFKYNTVYTGWFVECQGIHFVQSSGALNSIFTYQSSSSTQSYLFLGTISNFYASNPSTMSVKRITTSDNFYARRAIFTSSSDYYLAGYIQSASYYQGYMYTTKATQSCYQYTAPAWSSFTFTSWTTSYTNTWFPAPMTYTQYTNTITLTKISNNLQISNGYCSWGGQLKLTVPASQTETCYTGILCTITTGSWTTDQTCADDPLFTLDILDPVTLVTQTTLSLSVSQQADNSFIITYTPSCSELGTHTFKFEVSYYNDYLLDSTFQLTIIVKEGSYQVMPLNPDSLYSYRVIDTALQISLAVDTTYFCSTVFTCTQALAVPLPSFMAFAQQQSNLVLTVETDKITNVKLYSIVINNLKSGVIINSCTFKVNVTAEGWNYHAPIFSTIKQLPNFKVQVRSFQSYVLPATEDLDGDHVLVSAYLVESNKLKKLPNFINLDDKVFIFAPSDNIEVGSYQIQVNLIDNNNFPHSLSTSYQFKLTVTPYYPAPIINISTSNNNTEENNNSSQSTQTIIRYPITSYMTAKIENISLDGQVYVLFSRNLSIPLNYTQWNDQEMVIYLYKSGTSEKVKVKFNVTNIYNYTMVIKLVFDSPLEVSPGFNYDFITVQFVQKELICDITQTQTILYKYEISHYILPQYDKTSKLKQQDLTSMMGALKGAMQAIGMAALPLNFALGASLSLLWGMVNSIQIMAHMPLFTLALPANLQILQTIIITLSQFNLLGLQSSISKFFQFKDQNDIYFNQQYDAMGYNSMNILLNIAEMLFYLFIIISISFVVFCLSCLKYLEGKRIFKLIEKNILFSTLLRYLLESYLELGICSAINLYQLNYAGSGDRAASVISILLVAMTIFFPVYVGAKLQYSKDSLESEGFLDTYSSLIEGQDVKKSIFFNFVFLIRRLIFILTAVLLTGYGSLQVLITQFLSLLLLCYLLVVKPFKSKLLNYLEMFNELCIYITTQYYLFFCNVIEDRDRIWKMGFECVILFGVNVLINLGTIITISSIRLYQKIKQWYRAKYPQSLKDNHKVKKNVANLNDNREPNFKYVEQKKDELEIESMESEIHQPEKKEPEEIEEHSNNQRAYRNIKPVASDVFMYTEFGNNKPSMQPPKEITKTPISKSKGKKEKKLPVKQAKNEEKVKTNKPKKSTQFNKPKKQLKSSNNINLDAVDNFDHFDDDLNTMFPYDDNVLNNNNSNNLNQYQNLNNLNDNTHVPSVNQKQSSIFENNSNDPDENLKIEDLEETHLSPPKRKAHKFE